MFAGEDAASKHSEVNLFALIGNVMDEAPAEDSPYKELTEYFRLCERTPFTLTFSQIADIIGCDLDKEAFLYDAFWYDDMPERSSPLWEVEGYEPDADMEDAPRYCIAESWLSQGYQIKSLHREERRVVFRKIAQGVSGLEIPKVLLEKKLPDDAIYEINQFFAHIIKKYGL